MSPTILVIDDDNAIRHMLINVLHYKGYKTINAADAYHALDLLNNDPMPDLILCDVFMPDMNGYELLSHIRAQPHLSNIPIIMISADKIHTNQRAILASGATDYLTKPFTPQQLISLISQYLPVNCAA